MLVFTVYFHLVFTPKESSCHLPSSLVPAPWEVTAKKTNMSTLLDIFRDPFLDSFFLVYFVAREDCSS